MIGGENPTAGRPIVCAFFAKARPGPSPSLRGVAHSKRRAPEPTENPDFIVMPNTTGYGLPRMYQIVRELTQPLVSVAPTLEEPRASLGVQSAHFEPLEQPQLM